MNILILYDSIYGNTEKIAKAILDELDSDHQVRLARVSAANTELLEDVDLLLAGTPTHGGRPSDALKRLVDGLPAGSLKGIRAAAFDTSMPQEGMGFFLNRITRLFGHAAPKLAEALKEKGAAVAGAESFLVSGKEGPILEGETDRAAKWAVKLAAG